MVDKYKLQQQDMQSMNLNVTILNKLRQLLPEIFTENHTGNLHIDIDKLKVALGGAIDVEADNQTRYSFLWSGKKQAQLEANKPTTATLRPCIAESKNWDNTENVYIEGDNLEVLKLLQKSYYGKIKMIYIDPPYNTGKDFVYKDNYHDNVKNYLELTGQVDDNGNKIDTNTDSNGRYHTDWLNMMYPRLKLARNLLKDDGVIFISIDDNEVHNLRKVCDEIFGEDNFVGQISVENNPKGRKNSKFLSVSNDYCIIYSKNNELSYFIENIPKNIKDLSEDENGLFVHNSGKRVLVGENNFNRIVEDFNSDKHYTIYYRKKDTAILFINELDIKNIDKNLIIDGYVRYISFRGNKFVENTYTKSRLLELYKENALEFAESKIYEKNFNYLIRMKSLLVNRSYDALINNKPIKYKIDVNTTSAGNCLKDIFDYSELIFSAPKNIGLLKLLVTLFDENSFIILDFFSGSATTAHAVMQLNAEDGGTRKYICVQLPEETKPESEACKVGYKNICEIGKERIRRAGDKILTEWQSKLQQPNDVLLSDGNENTTTIPDIGFKVFKLDTSNIKPFNNNDLLNLDLYVENRSSLDLFYELVIKHGYTLEHKQSIIDIGGTRCYALLNIDSVPFVLTVLDDTVKDNFATAILKYPLSLVIVKDSCFSSDEIKLNTLAILEQLQNSGNALLHGNELHIRII